jgi:hypothetical protein
MITATEYLVATTISERLDNGGQVIGSAEGVFGVCEGAPL